MIAPIHPNGVQKPAQIRKISQHRLRVMSRNGFRCALCDVDLLRDVTTFYAATVDHLWPRSRGGLDGPENLIPCCAACNELKADFATHDLENARAYVAMRRAEFASYLLRMLQACKIDAPASAGRGRTFDDDVIAALGAFSVEAAQMVSRLGDLHVAARAIVERLGESASLDADPQETAAAPPAIVAGSGDRGGQQLHGLDQVGQVDASAPEELKV